MSRRYRECFGEVFRFQIMNGTLWVDHISERHQGWYPSKLGAGADSTYKFNLVLSSSGLL